MKPIYLLVRCNIKNSVESVSKWQIWKYEFICNKFSEPDLILTEIVVECDSKEETILNAAVLGVNLWYFPNFASFQSNLHLDIMILSPDKIWNYFCSQLKKIEY